MLTADHRQYVYTLGRYRALSKRVGRSSCLNATVTPAASIMGSGFLVSAPLLAGVVANLVVVCRGTLLALAYLVGGAIRFNIRYSEPIENKRYGPAQSNHTGRLTREIQQMIHERAFNPETRAPLDAMIRKCIGETLP